MVGGSAEAEIPAQGATSAGPGSILNGVAVLLFVISIVRGSERSGELDSILLIALAWALWILAWLFWLVAAIGAGRAKAQGIRRWIAVPLTFVAAAILVFGGFALDLRFAISRGALDAAADATRAGRHVASGWIGLYPVERMSSDGESVRVEIAGQHPFVRDAPSSADGSGFTLYESVDERWSIEIDLGLD